MSTKITPKFDRILVKRDSLVKEGSLIVLPSNKDAPASGIVLAVGPTAGTYRNGELVETVDVGAHIVFARHSGTDLSSFVDEKEGTLWLITDVDVLCVLTKEE